MSAPQFRDVDPTKFQQRFEESKNRPTGGNYKDNWKPRVGGEGRPVRNIIRLGPPHPNMDVDPFISVLMHFSLGPLGKNAIVCLKQFGLQCPACDFVAQLEAQAMTHPKDSALWKQLRAQAWDRRANIRFIAQIIDYTEAASVQKGWQPYPFGPQVEKDLRACFYDDAGTFRNIANPETGRHILMDVSTKPKTKFNQYDVVRAKESAEQLHDMGLLAQLIDLTSYSKQPTHEDVIKALTEVRQPGGGDASRATAGAIPSAAPVTAPPTPYVAPAPPVPAPYVPPAPPAPVPVPAPVPQAAPVPPPVSAAPPAPAPVPPSSPAPPTPSPATAVPPPAVPPPAAPPAVAPGNVPHPYPTAYATGRAAGFEATFIPDAAVLQTIKPPACYTREWLPADPECHKCRLYLPCGEQYLAAHPDKAVAVVSRQPA